jgi:hypothetical protein
MSWIFETLFRITANSWNFRKVQGKEHFSTVQRFGLRDVYLNSTHLNEGSENWKFFC